MAKLVKFLYIFGIVAFVITTLIGNKALKLKLGIVFFAATILLWVGMALYYKVKQKKEYESKS